MKFGNMKLILSLAVASSVLAFALVSPTGHAARVSPEMRGVAASASSQQKPPASKQPVEKKKATGDTKVEAITVEELDEAALARLLRPEGATAERAPLLVNFWATWCDPCREEFPDLVKIDDDYRPRGLQFITISLDDVSDIKTSVPEFLTRMRARRAPAYLLNANDPETAILGVDKDWRGELPATFLFDRTGQLVFTHKGRIKPAELRAAIDKTLDAKR